MRIGVDQDGVLADLTGRFLEYCNEKRRTSYRPCDIVRYEVWECLGISRDRYMDELDEFCASQYFQKITPVPGSQAGVAALRKMGHEPHVVTARPPSMKGTDIRAATNDWIKRYFPKAFYSVNFSGDFRSGNGGQGKAALCRRLGLHAMVDDNAEYAQACADAGIRAYLLDQPWNSRCEAKNVERCNGWKEVVKKISGI